MVSTACARAYRSNAVLTATPAQLVLMLYDGALTAIATAREAFGRPPEDLKRFEVINRQLIKARSILSELEGNLDFSAGGEFAQIMQRLYEYYNRRLFDANLKKDVAPVVEVERLLGEVRGAWAEMLRGPAPADAECSGSN